MYFLLFSLLTCLLVCHCLIEKDENENHCGLMKQWLETASLSMKIYKKGFHREMETTVELNSRVGSEVKVLLIHRLPRGVYVDPYQLASLSHQSDWQTLLESAIDLEAPAHKASGFVAYVYPTFDGPTPRTLKITLPIHGRYSEPSFDGKTFTSVSIELPELLLRTEKCIELSNLEPHVVMDAPCTANNSSTCSWTKMQHQQGYGTVSFQFPVGDGSLVTPISIGTLLVTLICCVTLSKYMWKHQI